MGGGGGGDSTGQLVWVGVNPETENLLQYGGGMSEKGVGNDSTYHSSVYRSTIEQAVFLFMLRVHLSRKTKTYKTIIYVRPSGYFI
jgi:hypothetical protein